MRPYLLVIGCGRSGTKYVAGCLQKLGLDVRHEADGVDGCVAWQAAGHGWTPCGIHADSVREKATAIVHLVRHPLDVIGSVQTFGGESWEYIFGLTMYCREAATVLERACWYWLEWNIRCDELAGNRFLIETLPVIPGIDAHSRSHRYERPTWDTIASKCGEDMVFKLKGMANRYGYAGSEL